MITKTVATFRCEEAAVVWALPADCTAGADSWRLSCMLSYKVKERGRASTAEDELTMYLVTACLRLHQVRN